MIADLHCHYPMHLVAKEPDAGGPKEDWLRQFVDKVEGGILDLVADIVNDAGWSSGWRVSLEGLRTGGAGTVCSVLYWPASEFDLPHLNGAPPLDGYFDYLRGQLEFVERELPGATADGTPVFVAKTATDSSKGRASGSSTASRVDSSSAETWRNLMSAFIGSHSRVSCTSLLPTSSIAG